MKQLLIQHKFNFTTVRPEQSRRLLVEDIESVQAEIKGHQTFTFVTTAQPAQPEKQVPQSCGS